MGAWCGCRSNTTFVGNEQRLPREADLGGQAVDAVAVSHLDVDAQHPGHRETSRASDVHGDMLDKAWRPGNSPTVHSSSAARAVRHVTDINRVKTCNTGPSCCLHLSLVAAAAPAPVLPPAPLLAAAAWHSRCKGVRLGASTPYCLLRIASLL
jgi:hypothetical protein